MNMLFTKRSGRRGGGEERRLLPPGDSGQYLGTLLVVTLTVCYGHLVSRDPEPYAGLLPVTKNDSASERTEYIWGFPDGAVGKESTHKAGDLGSIPGSGRSPGGRNSNPLQYSCLENPMGRGTW